MKRIPFILTTAILLFLLTACGQKASAAETSRSETLSEISAVETEASVTAASESEAVIDDTPGLQIFSDGIQRAESVYPFDGGILISNFGGPEGGYVLFRKDGHTETLIPPGAGLISPTGMAAGNGRLFICDGDALKVFEADVPGKGFFEIHIAGNGHLFNDAAVDGNLLYISVTDEDAIYRMDISEPEKIPETVPERRADVPGPNGIEARDGILYIASISKDFTSVNAENVIYRISDTASPKAEILVDSPGLYDGVTLSDDGDTLYYSDWNTASVEAVNLKTGETETIYKETGMGPADIACGDGVLYIPDLPGSRILEITLDKSPKELPVRSK